jgi:hypothetical protein
VKLKQCISACRSLFLYRELCNLLALPHHLVFFALRSPSFFNPLPLCFIYQTTPA